MRVKNGLPGISCWDFSGIYRLLSLPVSRKEILYHDMTDLPGTNCYCDDDAAEKIRAVMREEESAGIHFIDTGNYHYMSYLYLSVLQRKTLLVVFDHHTDMQEPAFGGLLSCGGWVKRSLQDLPHIVNTWVIGPEEQDIEAAWEGLNDKAAFLSEENLKSFRSEGNLEEKTQAFIRETLKESLKNPDGPEQVYISVDKDILSPEYASCPWSQGDVSLEELSFMLSSVLIETRKAGLDLAGIDICGESLPEDPEGCIKSEMTGKILFDLLNRELSDEK